VANASTTAGERTCAVCRSSSANQRRAAPMSSGCAESMFSFGKSLFLGPVYPSRISSSGSASDPRAGNRDLPLGATFAAISKIFLSENRNMRYDRRLMKNQSPLRSESQAAYPAGPEFVVRHAAAVGGKNQERIFCRGGQRNLLKSLDPDKRIQGNPRTIQALFLERFGWAWRDLVIFGVNLDIGAASLSCRRAMCLERSAPAGRRLRGRRARCYAPRLAFPWGSASRRGGRAVEGARLESVYTGNRIAGSNPAPSATT
jgi:hypothetical protein